MVPLKPGKFNSCADAKVPIDNNNIMLLNADINLDLSVFMNISPEHELGNFFTNFLIIGGFNRKSGKIA